MKKILTLLAIALATLTSCNEKEKVEKEYIWLDIQQVDDGWWYEDIEAFGDTEKSISIVAYGEGYDGYAESIQEESDWIVSCDADWCHFEYELKESFYSDASYNRLILDFICEDNMTGEDRVATITVSVKDATYEIDIRQLGVPSVTVSSPGTLTQELADKDLLYATSLKISGELNDKDLETIKGLRDIETLDLTDAVIEDLPDEMFYRNETVKNIRLPRSITTIHPATFTYSSLEYVYFPANIEKIEDGGLQTSNNFIAVGAFSETPLRAVEFEVGSRLAYIGDGTFTGCGVKDSYESIGGETIYYSTLNITLPASVEHIGSFAFGGTRWYETGSGLYAGVEIKFEKDSKLRNFGKASSDDVARRGNYAVDCACGFRLDLSNCRNVGYVGRLDAHLVGAGVNTASMKIGSTTPPECQGVSVRNDRTSHLYVPKGCVGVYYEAEGWKNFDKIEEIGQE